MALSAFHNVELPQRYSYSSKKQLSVPVMNFTADSGDASAMAASRVVFAYTAAFRVRTYDQLAELRRFYYCRGGGMYAFMFTDLEDSTSAADGISPPTKFDHVLDRDPVTLKYYLAKRYGTAVRRIMTPSTVIIADNGSVVTGSCTVNLLTGEVSGYTPSSPGAFTAGFTFRVPVVFTGGFDAVWADWNASDVALDMTETLEIIGSATVSGGGIAIAG